MATKVLQRGAASAIIAASLIAAPAAEAASVPAAKLDISKLSVDINATQRKAAPATPLAPTLFEVNLINRIRQSAEALWRNPVRARIAKWGQDELRPIFNGVFVQSHQREWDRYETFGKCYTAPDPFKNDDPPYKAAFII